MAVEQKPTFEEWQACSELVFEWADSYDTKDWKRLASILAPTIKVNYAAVNNYQDDALPAESFVKMMSGPGFLGDPLIHTQHFIGATKWRKLAPDHIEGKHQIRAAHQRYKPAEEEDTVENSNGVGHDEKAEKLEGLEDSNGESAPKHDEIHKSGNVEDTAVENGAVENGTVETISAENDTTQNGTVENGTVENGAVENGAIEKVLDAEPSKIDQAHEIQHDEIDKTTSTNNDNNVPVKKTINAKKEVEAKGHGHAVITLTYRLVEEEGEKTWKWGGITTDIRWNEFEFEKIFRGF